MELWDIYDINHNKTGKIINKYAEYTQEGEYHLGAIVCILNKDKEVLLQQRSFNKKTYPGKWSLTGGAVLSGETAEEGAIREVYEELNITLSKNSLCNVGSFIERNAIIDIFISTVESENLNITIQQEELIDYKWFSIDEIKAMCTNKEIAENAIKAITMTLTYLKI